MQVLVDTEGVTVQGVIAKRLGAFLLEEEHEEVRKCNKLLGLGIRIRHMRYHSRKLMSVKRKEI